MAALHSLVAFNKVYDLKTSLVADPIPRFPIAEFIPNPAGRDIGVVRVISRMHLHGRPPATISEYVTTIHRASDLSILGGTVVDSDGHDGPVAATDADYEFRPDWFVVRANDGFIGLSYAFDSAVDTTVRFGVFHVVVYAFLDEIETPYQKR